MTEDSMECVFCAERIRRNAVLCRFCGAELVDGAWRRAGPGPRQLPRARGAFTMRFAGVAFLLSAVFELFSIGSATPIFGELRGGVVAWLYHLTYVTLFTGLGIGLYWARPWGYRALLIATWFYTVDNLRFALDRSSVEVQVAELLKSLGGLGSSVDQGELVRTIRLSAVTFVACWWGFLLFVRARREYFAQSTSL